MASLSFAQMKSQGLEDFWRLDADDPRHRIERTSQAAHVANTLLDLAIEQCRSKEFRPDSHEAWMVIETAGQLAADLTFPTWIANGSYHASTEGDEKPEEVSAQFRLTYDSNPRNLIDEAKRGNKLLIDREEFQVAVGNYLRSEFRSSELDRIIMFTLIDMETSAYLEEIYWKNPITRASNYDDYRALKSPFSSWISARLKGLGYAVLICVSAWVLIEHFGLIDSSWLQTVVLVVAGYWVVTAILGLVLLPFAIAHYRPNKEKLGKYFEKLPDLMMKVYEERWTEGPVSVSRLRKVLEDAAEVGATWPSSLWPLLEDIEARGLKLV